MVGRFISILVAIAVLAGCNDCEEPEPCPIATVELYSTPADSICFGSWSWLYTIKWHWSSIQEEWVISDTVFPGEAESGFEVLESVHGTVNDREIYFTINGVVASGCYKEWNSAIYSTSTGPSETVVRAVFYQWDAPGFGGLIVDAYVPEEPNDPQIAQISGLWMFYVSDEYEAGVLYRNRFIKTD